MKVGTLIKILQGTDENKELIIFGTDTGENSKFSNIIELTNSVILEIEKEN